MFPCLRSDSCCCSCRCCSHLGGFFLFLGLAVAGQTEWRPAGAAAAPGFMAMVMTSANASSLATNNSSVRKQKLLPHSTTNPPTSSLVFLLLWDRILLVGSEQTTSNSSTNRSVSLLAGSSLHDGVVYRLRRILQADILFFKLSFSFTTSSTLVRVNLLPSLVFNFWCPWSRCYWQWTMALLISKTMSMHSWWTLKLLISDNIEMTSTYFFIFVNGQSDLYFSFLTQVVVKPSRGWWA